jgi:DNA-binding response OmpR family regulator
MSLPDHPNTRTIIISDQAVYLRGLRSLFLSMSGIDLVAEGLSAAEAFECCQRFSPDLVLLDLCRVPDRGRETAEQISRQWPRIKVVLLVQCEVDDVVPIEAAGRALYQISRYVSEEELIAAIDYIRGLSDDMQTFLHAPEEEPEPARVPVTAGPAPSAQETMASEMVMAGRIQADILPEEPPSLAGWEIAARLEPARETSGDFYDFIPLTDRKWGILVADVSDKGMGASLFMALSSSLMRTYANRFPNLPALTLSMVSERILSDTRGGMFVTTFFGVLEPFTGRFTYANAGHPPAYLISAGRKRGGLESMRPTGMALGVSEDAQWRQKVMRIAPGDVLVMYTDGVTEAQSPLGSFFGEEGLVDAVLSRTGGSAQEILDCLLDAVHTYVGSMTHQDDIALVVIRRLP